MPAPNITLTPTKSSQIHAYGYDPESKILAIQFHARTTDKEPKPGAVYHYHEVSPEDYAAFHAAPSKYSHFHANKGKAFAKFTKQP